MLEYYNSLGFRDAGIIETDTQYINNKGHLNVDLKVDEGQQILFRKYYLERKYKIF